MYTITEITNSKQHVGEYFAEMVAFRLEIDPLLQDSRSVGIIMTVMSVICAATILGSSNSPKTEVFL